MNTIKLSNVPLDEFRRFLQDKGCRVDKSTKGKGGHERWVKKGLLRPIILQSHINPVPEMVIRNDLRSLGVSRKEFEDWLLMHN